MHLSDRLNCCGIYSTLHNDNTKKTNVNQDSS